MVHPIKHTAYMSRLFFAFLFLLAGVSSLAQPAYLESYFTALCSFNEKRFDEAKEYANQSLANGLSEVDGFLFLGDVYTEMGQVGEAESNYLKAEALKPGVAAFGIAQVCAITGRDSLGCVWVLRSLESPYKLSQSVYLRNKRLQRMESSSFWKTLWNGDYYSKGELLDVDLEYLISKGKYDEALELLNERGEKHRLRHQQQALMGRIYYEQQSYSSAADNYSLAIKRSSQNPDYFFCRARAYIMLKKYGKALDDIQKAIELNPLNPEYYLAKAKANVGYGNTEQSRADFNLYLKAAGQSHQALFEYVKLLEQGDFHIEALRQINKCITLKPDAAEYYLMRASIYMKTNGYKYAVDDYAMALDLQPPTAAVYLQKGYARSAMGDSQGACIDWKKAASMGSLDAQSMIARYCR